MSTLAIVIIAIPTILLLTGIKYLWKYTSNLIEVMALGYDYSESVLYLG